MDAAAATPTPGDRRGAKRRPALASCPMCEGKMEVVYQRNNQQVTVCIDCHASLTVPAAAWQISRAKRARR